MKTKSASAIVSTLVYAQALLVVAAVTAVVLRLPAEERRQASAENPVVASIVLDSVAQ